MSEDVKDGVSVQIKSTDWETATGNWLTILNGYRPSKDMIWVDWEKRTLSIEKDYKSPGTKR